MTKVPPNLQKPLLDSKAIIGQTLTFLHPDGAVFELCIIAPKDPKSRAWEGYAGGKKAIVAGWYRDHWKVAQLAPQIKAAGVYITLNPCQEALLGRANERLKAQVDRTKDAEISHIKNLLIDLDPIRPAGVSSTDQEHEAALAMGEVIRADLEKEGWTEPLPGDSGNGGHLIYPVDLAPSEENIALLKAVLAGLARRYADQLVARGLDLDQAVFNPARLTKLYGTMARKGDDTQDRPHRLARIISLPEARIPVPVELLEKIAGEAEPKDTPKTPPHGQMSGHFDLEAYLHHYNVEVLQVKPQGGATLYCLEHCIFDSTHADGEAAIGQAADGLLYYQCFHNSCKGRIWAEARQIISGDAKLGNFTSGRSGGYEPGCNGGATREAAPLPQDEQQKTAWDFAAQLVPRIPFPWEALPSDIADSLQQLGRACATSSSALPGAGFCLMGSIIGRTLLVSPKEGWDAPLILWHMDIRESGEGKTPPVRLMARPVNEAQRKEEICYREAMDDYKRLPRKERDQQPPPAPPRGYFVSDLTLEGLRDDLVNSPHGGIVVIQDEISAFLSGQNQYKSKGTDREAWLALHDGHPARIVRAGRTVYLNGARVSIFGGVQPKVFKTFFAGEDGLYLSDGTLFRFLMTCEPPTYYDLTMESWSDRDREKWETVLNRAMDWVDGQIYAREGKIEKPARMILSSEAQGRFFDWRNQLVSCKDRLPAQLRGFVPKAAEYVLRLTGIINCIQIFSQGGVPGTVLSLEDLERGIKTVHFYLGQVQDALRLIENEDYVPVEISERSRLLARTLDQLRPHLENGRLAIGFIHKHYNLIAPNIHKIETPKGMGAVIRAVKLTISPDKHDANGHRAAKCLEWDQQSEKFIKQSLQTQDRDADIGNSTQTLQTSEKECLHPENFASSGSQDIADIADMGESISEKFSPSLNWQEVSEGAVIPPRADREHGAGKNYAKLPDSSDTDSEITDPADIVQCGNCQNFSASPRRAGGKGIATITKSPGMAFSVPCRPPSLSFFRGQGANQSLGGLGPVHS